MERSLGSGSQFMAQKKKKKKKTQQSSVKVVYISNPMRVTTSPADFRALVQKLTGRDSDACVAESSAGTCEYSGGWSSPSEMSSGGAADQACDNNNSLVAPAEVFDDEQMLERLFCGFVSSPSLYNH